MESWIDTIDGVACATSAAIGLSAAVVELAATALDGVAVAASLLVATATMPPDTAAPTRALTTTAVRRRVFLRPSPGADPDDGGVVGAGGAGGAGGGAKEVAFASNVGGWVGGFITSVIGLSAVLSNSGEGSANPSLRAPRHTSILSVHGEGPVRARRG